MQQQRNAIAGVLHLPCFRKQKHRKRKGKGSYTRKGKSKGLPFPYGWLPIVKVNRWSDSVNHGENNS
jgi:hypothetical protein